jgi:uncharacterized damage-inducible protein DinB
MTLPDLLTLLDYHYWARDRMLDALEPLTPDQFNQDLGSSFKSIRETVAHLYSAEWAWYERWRGRMPTAPLPLDLFPDVAAVRQQWIAQEGNMREFLVGLDDDRIAREIEYKLLSGAVGSASIAQMLQHVVNHASYHRGQVTTMLRQVGATSVPSTDLIRFYRSRS